MNDITQNQISHFDYHKILSSLLRHNPSTPSFPDQAVYKIIKIIGLTSGLPLGDVIHFKWSYLLEINSKGSIQLKKEIDISRYYSFPLNLRIIAQLKELYTSCKQPDLETRIIDAFSEETTLDDVIKNASYTASLGLDISYNIRMDYKESKITQILFGRRVLEVCGRTNTSMKFLKSILGFKANTEILEFLGFTTDEKITYLLSNVTLVEIEDKTFVHGPPPNFLDENKHFYRKIDNSDSYYSFEDFQVFYTFIGTSQSYKYNDIDTSITFLLILGLVNGIRLSSLLKLKWSDFIDLESTEPYLKLKEKITFNTHRITVTEKVVNKLHQCFKDVIERTLNIEARNTYFEEARERFDFDTPCFTTNLGNPLTSNSLQREIRNTLTKLKYKHAEKFTTKSTMIMYGRRLIDIKGYHKPTIQELKKCFGYRSERELFEFLHIDVKSIKSPTRFHKPEFDQILYDL